MADLETAEAFLKFTKTGGGTGALGIETGSPLDDKMGLIVRNFEKHGWIDEGGNVPDANIRELLERYYPGFLDKLQPFLAKRKLDEEERKRKQEEVMKNKSN